MKQKLKKLLSRNIFLIPRKFGFTVKSISSLLELFQIKENLN